MVEDQLPSALILRPIESGDIVTRFSLGLKEFAPLKKFLKKEAKTYHTNSVGFTYVLVDDKDPPVVWGYITLNCSQVELDGSDRPGDCAGVYYYKDYPAVKVARLAIHKLLSRQGLGNSLVDFAVATVKEYIMPNVGCRFIVVDSKKSAVSYYKRLGFRLLDTPENKNSDEPVPFLDLQKI